MLTHLAIARLVYNLLKCVSNRKLEAQKIKKAKLQDKHYGRQLHLVRLKDRISLQTLTPSLTQSSSPAQTAARQQKGGATLASASASSHAQIDFLTLMWVALRKFVVAVVRRLCQVGPDVGRRHMQKGRKMLPATCHKQSQRAAPYPPECAT